MHKNATKCNETLSKWYKNKHGASKIMDTLETYHPSSSSYTRSSLSCRLHLIHLTLLILFAAPPSSCHHGPAWLGAGPRHPVVRLAPGPPPSHLRSSRSFGKNRRFSFCFVQFREYFLCNFSETQKQQKTGN